MLDVPIALASDVPRIRQCIADTQAEIDFINNHISSLETRRQELQDILIIHKYLVAPIRQLPNEILGEIFMNCVDAAFNDPSRDTSRRNSTEAPLVLAMVCRVWRDVALSIPELWCSISIILDPDTLSIQYAQKLADLHFQRSRQFPWRFRLDFKEIADEGYETYYHLSLATAIHIHPERWEYASFSGMAFAVLKALRQNPLNLPLLKGLEIHPAADERVNLEGFRNAPQLTSLTLSGDGPLNRGPNSFPYRQLTKLKASEMYTRDLWNAMRFMDALEECIIIDCRDEFANDSPPAELSNILSFTIIGMELKRAIYGQKILKFLSAPLLTSLSVKSLVEHDIGECLLSFLSRSSCPLKKLSLEFSEGELRTTDEDVFAMLEKIPTLEELKLFGYCVLRDQLLDRIFPNSESQTALCPRLQSFDFLGPLDLDGGFFQTAVLPRLDKPDDLDRQKEFWAGILWTSPLERTTFELDLSEFDN